MPAPDLARRRRPIRSCARLALASLLLAASLLAASLLATSLPLCSSPPLASAIAKSEEPPASPLPPFEIAITIDDLPFVSGLGPGDSRPQATARILSALADHHAPATGFVVCEREGDELLQQWLAAGIELGNHSSAHRHLDRISLTDWSADLRACNAKLASLTGTPPRWFRYPFLQTGRTSGRRDSARAIVSESGLRSAFVSVDTGEWALVSPYVQALSNGDHARADSIGSAYLEHLMAAIDHYRTFARAHVGRDVRHILLLHANALAADRLDSLLTRIEAADGRFITLEEALSDSVYALPDRYAGPIGLSWLYRVASADSAWAWDNAQVQSMTERFPAE